MLSMSTYDVSKVKAALNLEAHGIDSRQSFCTDLINTPAPYYSSAATIYSESSKQQTFRVRFDEKTSTTIYNDPDTDPRLKAALAQRIIAENTGVFADEMERKCFSFLSNALSRVDIEMLVQVVSAMFVADPEKAIGFAQTTSELFMNSGAGIKLTKTGESQILLHPYHGNCAVAIDSENLSASVVPISTEWDGTVIVEDGEVLSPTVEGLLERIKEQYVQRILLKHEVDGDDCDTLEVPAVFGQAA